MLVVLQVHQMEKSRGEELGWQLKLGFQVRLQPVA